MNPGMWYYEYKDLLFEWDTEKERINVAKHDITFETAAHVFLDDKRLDYFDSGHSYDEDRFVVIGYAEIYLVTVIYTMRGSAFRIISARTANIRERRAYLWQ